MREDGLAQAANGGIALRVFHESDIDRDKMRPRLLRQRQVAHEVCCGRVEMGVFAREQEHEGGEFGVLLPAEKALRKFVAMMLRTLRCGRAAM